MTKFLKLSFLAAMLPMAALAQTPTTTTATFDSTEWGPRAENFEFTLGGSGLANKDMDDSGGGISFSIGKYINDRLLTSIRQTVNYANPNNGDRALNGSTVMAFDQHFGTSRWRPFVGLNIGAIYGDNVQDTFAAGLEGGLKFYVQPKTFIFAMAQYEFLFDKGSDIDNHFNDGQYIWSVGVGFHF